MTTMFFSFEASEVSQRLKYDKLSNQKLDYQTLHVSARASNKRSFNTSMNLTNYLSSRKSPNDLFD